MDGYPIHYFGQWNPHNSKKPTLKIVEVINIFAYSNLHKLSKNSITMCEPVIYPSSQKQKTHGFEA